MKGAVKIHSMESKTITPICFRFQVNKCTFGDKCKYRHIKDPNFKLRDNKENKGNNGADKNNSHPKGQIRNLQLIIIIVLLVLHEENHLMEKLQHTQQCKLEH